MRVLFANYRIALCSHSELFFIWGVSSDRVVEFKNLRGYFSIGSFITGVELILVKRSSWSFIFACISMLEKIKVSILIFPNVISWINKQKGC